MLTVKLSAPVAGVSELKFQPLMWGQYKALSGSSIRETVEGLAALADPSLSPEQVAELTMSDYDQLNRCFAKMTTRAGSYKKGEPMRLDAPIDVGGAEVVSLRFAEPKLGDMFDYIEQAGLAATDLYIQKCAHGLDAKGKVVDAVILQTYIERMLASDVIFIQDNIEGKR